MKRLILVRHGKSSWKYDVPDDKRPLKKRGLKDGDLIASAFEKFFNPPVLIWSSPAVRALETAKIFKKKLNIPENDFVVKPALYTFNKKDLLAHIETCKNSIDKLMIFGHNPAMTSLVNELGDKYFNNVPTTGLTIIDFETNRWKDLNNGKTILNLFPKNLR